MRASSTLPFTLGMAAVMVLAYFTPFAANAAQVTAQTVQLLPPGLNVCQPIVTPEFKEYVYEGELHSFDLYVLDPSYVAVAVSVGETELPFTFITRSFDASGKLRMHVDTPSIPLQETHPIVLTLISSLPGSPTCMTQVMVQLDGEQSFSATQKAHQPAVSKQTIQPKKISVAPQMKQQGIEKKQAGKAASDSVLDGVATGTSVAQMGTLEKICETSGGAARLWTILLAVYFLIIAATILALPEGRPSTQSSVLLAIAIGGPLLVLLSVWKAAPSCHAGAWTLVTALLIAGTGIILGFRYHPSVAKLLDQGK